MGLFKKNKVKRNKVLKGLLKTVTTIGVNVGAETIKSYPGASIALKALKNAKDKSDASNINNLALILAHSKDFIAVVEDALSDGELGAGEIDEIKELASTLHAEITNVIPEEE